MSVRWLNGWLVCWVVWLDSLSVIKERKVTIPFSYRSTCLTVDEEKIEKVRENWTNKTLFKSIMKI